MKPFQSQIRLHKWNVDEAQRRLSDLVQLDERLRADLQRLADETLREQEAANQSPEALYAYGRYAEQLVERRARLEQSILEVGDQITHAQETLRDAFAELKKYELAAEAAQERAKRKRDQRDQIEQDEIAIGIFRRRE